MDPELLERICCPETHQPLRLAEAGVVDKLNALVGAERGLSNRAGKPVETPLEGGLIREDGKWLYPIVHGIPILLIDEAIDVASFLS